MALKFITGFRAPNGMFGLVGPEGNIRVCIACNKASPGQIVPVRRMDGRDYGFQFTEVRYQPARNKKMTEMCGGREVFLMRVLTHSYDTWAFGDAKKWDEREGWQTTKGEVVCYAVRDHRDPDRWLAVSTVKIHPGQAPEQLPGDFLNGLGILGLPKVLEQPKLRVTDGQHREPKLRVACYMKLGKNKDYRILVLLPDESIKGGIGSATQLPLSNAGALFRWYGLGRDEEVTRLKDWVKKEKGKEGRCAEQYLVHGVGPGWTIGILDGTGVVPLQDGYPCNVISIDRRVKENEVDEELTYSLYDVSRRQFVDKTPTTPVIAPPQGKGEKLEVVKDPPVTPPANTGAKGDEGKGDPIELVAAADATKKQPEAGGLDPASVLGSTLLQHLLLLSLVPEADRDGHIAGLLDRARLVGGKRLDKKKKKTWGNRLTALAGKATAAEYVEVLASNGLVKSEDFTELEAILVSGAPTASSSLSTDTPSEPPLAVEITTETPPPPAA